MILDRNAETASFLFNTEAKKVYLTDEQYKAEGAALEQKDGFYVLPVNASELEASGLHSRRMEKTYYVLAESTTGRKLRFNVTVYQRDNAMDTPQRWRNICVWPASTPTTPITQRVLMEPCRSGRWQASRRVVLV